MAICLCLAVQQKAKLQDLAIQSEFGVSGSAFPLVEAWLSHSEHAKALLFVASRKSAKNYKSVVDWLYCETFPGMRGACQRFYADKGPLLRELIGESRRKFEQRVLLHVLWVAYNAYAEDRKTHWSAVRSEALTYFGR